MAIDKLDSQYGILNQSELYGAMPRFIQPRIPATTTAATTTSGYVTAGRYDTQFTVPSHSGFDGWLPSFEFGVGVTGMSVVACLEYDLGSINIATGTFTAGSSMPTKSIRSEGTTYPLQTASMLTMAVVTTALTGTAVVPTITYTNQDGTSSRSTSGISLPAAATINSAFDITPYLQSGDTGVQSISNITKTGGTAGILAIKGIIPLQWSFTGVSVGTTNQSIMNSSMPFVLAESGETVAFYRFGSNAISFLQTVLKFKPI